MAKEFNDEEKEALRDVLDEYRSYAYDVWDEDDLKGFLENLKTDARAALGLDN